MMATITTLSTFIHEVEESVSKRKPQIPDWLYIAIPQSYNKISNHSFIAI